MGKKEWRNQEIGPVKGFKFYSFLLISRPYLLSLLFKIFNGMA